MNENKYQKECPGDGWMRGKIRINIKDKKPKSDL